jgi:hypothetical protein
MAELILAWLTEGKRDELVFREVHGLAWRKADAHAGGAGQLPGREVDGEVGLGESPGGVAYSPRLAKDREFLAVGRQADCAMLSPAMCRHCWSVSTRSVSWLRTEQCHTVFAGGRHAPAAPAG